MLIEEISRACHIVGLALSMPSGLVGGGILRYGTEEQKQRLHRRRCVRGESFAGAGVTEPGSGTDVANMADDVPPRGRRVRDQRRQGVDQHARRRPTGSSPSRRIDRSLGRNGVCAFIVPTRHARACRCSPTRTSSDSARCRPATWCSSDVRVPVENRVGEEGDGYKRRDGGGRDRPAVGRRACGRPRAGMPGRVRRLRAASGS